MNVVIIGASAVGREVCSWISDYSAVTGNHVKGFLDSRKNILDGYTDYPKILASPEEYTPERGDVFICALGEPDMRQKYVSLIEKKGGKFKSFIHPSSFVGESVEIGTGTVVYPHSTLTADIKVGKHCIIGSNTSIGHDCVLEDFVTLSPGCQVAGWCHLHSGTFMGISSTLIPHVTLGGKSPVYVAAGATVAKSFEEGRLMGVLAKVKSSTTPKASQLACLIKSRERG